MLKNLNSQKISIGYIEALVLLIGVLIAIYLIKQKDNEILKLKNDILVIDKARVSKLLVKDSLFTLEINNKVRIQDSLILSLQSNIVALNKKDYELHNKIKAINNEVNSSVGTLPIFK